MHLFYFFILLRFLSWRFLQNNRMFLRIDIISVTFSYNFFFGFCVTDIADYVARMPELMRALPGKTEKRKEKKIMLHQEKIDMNSVLKFNEIHFLIHFMFSRYILQKISFFLFLIRFFTILLHT